MQRDEWHRSTPYMKAHSTLVAGMHENVSGDMRFYNNLFAPGGDLSQYNTSVLPMHLGGNVFLADSLLCNQEVDPLVRADFVPGIQILDPDGHPHISLKLDRDWSIAQTRPLVTTALLGNALVPNLPFENPDGSPITIDHDFTGAPRDPKNPFPGPFEITRSGTISVPIHTATL